jgi:TatD DNase family protein
LKQENHETVDGRPCTFRLIDTHCHLDDPAFAPDLEQVLRRSAAAGVRSWLNVGYSPERWASTIDLGSRFIPALPWCSASTRVRRRPGAQRWRRRSLICSGNPELARWGETGIDLFRGETNLDQQRAVFEQQLR